MTASRDHTTKVWDAQTGKLSVNLKEHTDAVNSAVFSPDGKRVVTSYGQSVGCANGKTFSRFERTYQRCLFGRI